MLDLMEKRAQVCVRVCVVESEMGEVYERMGEKQRMAMIHMGLGYNINGHVQPRLRTWSPVIAMAKRTRTYRRCVLPQELRVGVCKQRLHNRQDRRASRAIAGDAYFEVVAGVHLQEQTKYQYDNPSPQRQVMVDYHRLSN